MRFLKKIMLPFFICIACSSFAQVKINFNSITKIEKDGYFKKSYTSKIDLEIKAKNIDSLLAIDKKEIELSGERKQLNIAIPQHINVDISKLCNWVTDADYAFGKYTIKLDKALSASINFDNFYLPTGTEMFVYNEQAEMITGTITEKENNKNNVWGSWVYKGEYITIEIKTPIATKENLLLHANNIAYGFKEIYKNKTSGFGQSGACNINVLCPLGIGWEAERNSVGILLSGNGSAFCSGSMIMNTCNNNRPFFLTADHCYGGDNVALWRFGFQAWSATCSPSQNSDGTIFNGATLRANAAPSDFCLVELNNVPAVNSGINYAGWNRSATAAIYGMGIHHPSGDVMKISRANNPVIRAIYGGGTTHWRADWTQGVTEGGSSGSPLFDQNHRIIGQLDGGPSACNATQLWDYYGSFDVSWIGEGTPSTRLSSWLDPSNSGALTTNSTNIATLNGQTISIATQPSDVNTCTGNAAAFSIAVLGTGVTYQWQSSPQGCTSVFTNIALATSNTYTIPSVTNFLNGSAYRVVISSNCANAPMTSNCGILTVNNAVAITTQPISTTTCLGNAANFTTAASGYGITFQWQISTNAGVNFTNITNAINATLNINTVSAAMNNNQYRVVVTSTCGGTAIITNAATLNIVSPTVITTQPANVSTCGTSAILNVMATGSLLNYQWQISTDAGATFNNIAGANSSSYALNNITPNISTNKYRVVVSSVACGSVMSNAIVIRADVTPAVSINAAPYLQINPAHTTSLTSSINPQGNYVYEWKRNNIIIPISTKNITGLNGKQDDFGTYQLTATDIVSGCKGSSNTVIITDIVEERDNLFIFPNPAQTIVQVSYYSVTNNIPRIINVYDAKGAKVLSKSAIVVGNYGYITIDISSMNRGVYMVELLDSNGKNVKNGKLVKQ